IVWIRNTQELGEFRVSDALIEDLPEAAVVTDRETVAFDAGTAAFEAAADGDADA
ncbi:DUF362 domain-containing protein, partial [Halorubrum sp. SS5]